MITISSGDEASRSFYRLCQVAAAGAAVPACHLLPSCSTGALAEPSAAQLAAIRDRVDYGTTRLASSRIRRLRTPLFCRDVAARCRLLPVAPASR